MNDDAIVVFLQEIIESVKEKKINQNQRYLMGEMYLKYNFFTYCTDQDFSCELVTSMSRQIEVEKRFINFMLLGWYMFILSEIS